jgi:ubiquinone/menaquinone biosynthesis C-methylase UbiE
MERGGGNRPDYRAYAARMAGNVEYVGLMAEAWDALRGDTSEWPDRAFYLDVIRERGEPVLDVGCGTGRLLLDYLRLGIDVDGVDNSADMLAICRRKADRAGLRPNLFLQPMEDLDLPRRYATIIVPSSSFQLVIDPADAVAALAGLRRHLEPGGTLAMPFIAMDAPHEEHWVREAELEDGSIVRRTASAIYDPATRLESTDDLYEQLRDGAVVRSERVQRPEATRGYSRDQVGELLDEAGFDEVEWCSNFTREPSQPGDEIFTVLASVAED